MIASQSGFGSRVAKLQSAEVRQRKLEADDTLGHTAPVGPVTRDAGTLVQVRAVLAFAAGSLCQGTGRRRAGERGRQEESTHVAAPERQLMIT